MEPSQGEIIKNQKCKSCLPCSWHIVLLWCMHLWSFMNIFNKVLELWPGHESGTYRRSNRRGGIKNARVVFLVHDTSAQCHACTCIVSWIYSLQFRSYDPDTVYYMQLRQGKIIQKQKVQELSSLFMTHRINVMHALVKFHEYIPYSIGVMARTRLTIWNLVKGK